MMQWGGRFNQDDALWRGVPHDPLTIGSAVLAGIEAIGVSGATAFGSTVIFGSVTGASLVGSAALAVGTVGLSYASRALQQAGQRPTGPTASDPGAVNAPEVRGSIKQDIPPHRILFGETRAGGVIYFYRVVPPYLYIGLIHSLLPISSIEAVYISTRGVPFRALEHDTFLVPLPFGTPDYSNRLYGSIQFGHIDQGPNALIASAFPELGAQFRLPGIANSVWRFDFGADFDEFQALWGNVQIPDVQILATGCPLPDPRNARHVLDFDPRDMDSLYDAIGTWDYSNNASLAAAFWAAMPFGLNAGPAAVYGGRYVNDLKEAASFDDEMVGLRYAGGLQRRHTVDGLVTLDQKPLSIMEAMTIANGGFVSPRAGSIIVSSSQPRTVRAAIGDADIISWSSFKDARAKRDLVNTAHARFVSPEADYQDAETSWPSQSAMNAMVEDDGEVLEQTLRLGLVTTAPRTQRILKRFVDELRNNSKSLQLVVHPRLFGLIEGDIVTVALNLYPSANGTYSVEAWQIGDDFNGLGLSLVEYDAAAARDWVPRRDEQPYTVDALAA